MVPQADRLYAAYLDELKAEGFIKMPSTKKWTKIRAARSKPGVLEKSDANRAKRAVLLDEIRRARQMTQETLAETLGMTQSEVSKVEHRTDVYVSTLRRYIEAMGGELEIVARFPNGSVQVVKIAEQAEPGLAHA